MRRRTRLRVLDAHDAALDAQDAIGGIAELEDVAGQALDGEVLVHRADDLVLGLEQHLVVGVVGDRAAEVSAVSRAPRRPRSTPLTAS